jgi:acetyl esterase
MLHPQARALLDFIEARGIPPTHTLSPADARAFYRERRAATQPLPAEVAEVRDLAANGPHGTIPVRLYRPLGSGAGPLPVLVYFHGGGWVIGDLETHDVLCRSLANGAGCAVVAVDYRHGPGAPLSRPRCTTAWPPPSWVRRQRRRAAARPGPPGGRWRQRRWQPGGRGGH